MSVLRTTAGATTNAHARTPLEAEHVATVHLDWSTPERPIAQVLFLSECLLVCGVKFALACMQ